jgi:biotin synthase
MSSVNVSIGTAGVLGLADVPMDVAPTTAYLMLGGRCSMACGFCAQARTSQADALHLSRVTWPEFLLTETVERLAQTVERGAVRRCCLQVTAGQGYFYRALEVIRAVKAVTDVPLDAAVLPPTMAHVAELIAAGIGHIGFGLDAASERVFGRVKGGDWARSLRLIEETARRYPRRAAAHLIVGLGETERETVGTIQMLHDWGVTVGLFAFTPVRGTAMAHLPPPPLAAYRRVQAARHLIVHGLARADDFTFSLDGQLVDFGLPGLSALLADGVAFQTSGCPDCNRPYYNERPGGPFYNYPRLLSQTEVGRALASILLPQA